MANIHSCTPKWLFFVIIVISATNCSAKLNSNGKGLHFNDFEEIKRNLFTGNRVIEPQSENDSKCWKEILAIKDGLLRPQRDDSEWAIRILDAWGKFPSGFLDGNFYEFGAFSECFHIKRNEKLYNTKYCLGKLDINLPQKSTKLVEFSVEDDFFPHMKLMDDVEFHITPRLGVPTPTNLTGVIFGMCVPSVCNLDYLQKFVQIEHPIDKTISLSFLESTCQFEESASELRVLDWVTIGLLAIVALAVVLSTAYDILFTVNNREKCQGLLAFSVYSNGMKLLSYKQSKSPDVMHCLHGIRVISTAWVVLGHTFFLYPKLQLRNLNAFAEFVSKYHNMIILSAPISVDTFFLLSGLLVSINLLKHFEKTKGKVNILMLYFHRYLRLTPLLCVSVLFSMSLLRFLGNGPIWPKTIELLSQQCETNWWSMLLYIQNYANPKSICFGHSWYLSVDMQLFIISPLIVYLIYRFKTKALFAMAFLVVTCMGATVGIFMAYDINGRGHPLKNEKVYYPTHTRYSPWLIGVIAGYFFYKTRGRTIRIPRPFNLFAWALSLSIMAAVIFTNYPLQQLHGEHTALEYGIYDAWTRVCWAIALCYIIFACVNNSGGPVNWFLGHPLWQPISRLSYAIYLLHFPVVVVVMVSLKSSMYFTELTAYHTFIGNLVLTTLVSLIATLAFESPIVILEKILFSKKKNAHVVDKS